MRVLDLFCGAGGAAVGLKRAWPDADITGVDIKPQKRYPFRFVQADAMTFPLEGYDFIWASPPCQRYSSMFHLPKSRQGHPDLVGTVRERLKASGAKWCIENVEGAPVYLDFRLCGSMFGLQSSPTRYLQRHRRFEVNWPPPWQLPRCKHWGLAVGVYGHGSAGHLGQRMRTANAAEARVLMGIDWMTRDELSQAVPPAYSEYIARQLTLALAERVA